MKVASFSFLSQQYGDVGRLFLAASEQSGSYLQQNFRFAGF
jgi:hypothetical protein